jgi:hypothetical protein
MTQKNAIFHHLKSGARLTPIEALKRFGCYRLGARIWDLRQAGHTIHREMVEVKPGTYVARYKLLKAA